MILGRNFSKLNIYLCLSNNTIMGNGGVYKGCTVPMKDMANINCNTSSNWINYERFWNKDIRESKHVMNSTRCTKHTLDANYKK